MIGSWWHLARRFLEVLMARPLPGDLRTEASALLRPGEEERLFFDQPAADQRHGLAAARLVTGELRRAALLHDVGKQRAGLGVWGRSVASALAKLHVPVRGRLATYLDHGPLGAEMLEALGAELLVVEFARHHHHARPSTIGASDWDKLLRADRKARTLPPMAIR